MGFHYRVARPVRSIETEYFDFGSFVTAGSTLYWASSNPEEDDFICRINAFDLVNQKCYEESLHTDSIFGRHEVLDSLRPGLLNLPDGNFCLILQSKSMKRRRRLLYARYIYCVVLKVDKEEEEDDDVYKHGLRVSIVSVHKYSVDDWIPLLESVLVDEGKKLSSSNEWPSLRACNLLEN